MEISAERDKRTSDDRFHSEAGAYGVRHLVQHLIECEGGEDLRRLLLAEHAGGNAWHYARVISCSDLSGYLSDLESAQEFFLHGHTSEGDRATRAGDALIFPLLISETTDSYKHLTAALLEAALKHGLWSWRYIARLVDGLADEKRKLELIARALPYISGEEKFLASCWVMRALKKQDYSCWMINTALIAASNLGDGERKRLCRLLLKKIREAIGLQTPWNEITHGLKSIAALLEGRSLASALLILSRYANEEHKIAVLVSLFPKIRDHHSVLATEWERRRRKGEARAATDMALRLWDPSVAREQRAELMCEAVSLAFEWRTVYMVQTLSLVEFVGLFLDAVSEADAKCVLARILDNLGKCSEAYRAESLSALSAWFARLAPLEALQSIATLDDLEYRQKGLMALVPQLSSSTRSLVYRGKKWTSEPGSMIEHAVFCPFIEVDRRKQEGRALLFALVESSSSRGGLLSYLAPHLSDSMLVQAVNFMERYRKDPSDEGFWGDYDELLPYLSRELLQRVLSNVRAVSPREYEEEAMIFSLLGAYLPPEISREALRASYNAFRAFALYVAKDDLAAEAANSAITDKAEIVLTLVWALLIRVHVKIAWLCSVPAESPVIKDRRHNRWIRSAGQRMGLGNSFKAAEGPGETTGEENSQIVELARRHIPLVFSEGGAKSVADLYSIVKIIFRWRRSTPPRISVLLSFLVAFAEKYIGSAIRLYYVKQWRSKFSVFVLRAVTYIYITSVSFLCKK